jgi:FMN phosphatase YigB (HAD superfamily)
MIKAVVWDIGGVLFEDPDVGNFWGDTSGSKELRKEFGSGQISKEEFIKKGAKCLNIDEKSFMKKYQKTYLCPKKQIKESLEVYKKMKTDKYILSDTNPIFAEGTNDNEKEIYPFAKRVFLSHEIKLRKSDIQTFKFIIKEIGLNPNEILFIDNKEEYIRDAESLGIVGIHYQNPSKLKSDLKKLGIK